MAARKEVMEEEEVTVEPSLEEVMEEERGCRIVTRGGGGAETGGRNRAVGVIAERADRNFKEIEKDVVMMTDGVRVPKRRFHLPKDSLQESCLSKKVWMG